MSDSAPPMELRKPETLRRRTLVSVDLPAKPTDSAPPLELPQEEPANVGPGIEVTGFSPDYFNLVPTSSVCLSSSLTAGQNKLECLSKHSLI